MLERVSPAHASVRILESNQPLFIVEERNAFNVKFWNIISVSRRILKNDLFIYFPYILLWN